MIKTRRQKQTGWHAISREPPPNDGTMVLWGNSHTKKITVGVGLTGREDGGYPTLITKTFQNPRRSCFVSSENWTHWHYLPDAPTED